jgi:pimeloyl-ACP methyl ester carboxylesterase
VESLQITTRAGCFDALAAGPSGGRPVLFLHGFPEDAGQWQHQLRALAAQGLRAVAFDQRGYSPGARPTHVDAYRSQHLMQDVLDVAGELGWERFDLVGHDWGAAVAWMVAAAFPERLRSLTAVSVPHSSAFARALREDPEQGRKSAYFALFRTPGEAEERLLDGSMASFLAPLPQERIDHYVERMGRPGALTAALNWYRAMRAPARSGPIIVPTLYVWSTGDAFVGEFAAQAAAAGVEGPYRFEVLEGISHWISEEAPERLGALLLEHLLSY